MKITIEINESGGIILALVLGLLGCMAIYFFSKRKSQIPEMPRKRRRSTMSSKQFKAFKESSQKGTEFVKYGRYGDPHVRTVRFLEEKNTIDWGSGSISVSDILHVIPGKETPVFKRWKFRKLSPLLCFSVVTRERSLDLEASSLEQRHTWVEGIRGLVDSMHKAAMAARLATEQSCSDPIPDVRFHELKKMIEDEDYGDGWQELMDLDKSPTHRIRMWKREYPGEGPHIAAGRTVNEYRTHGIVPVPPERYVRVMMDIKYHCHWDANSKKIDLVESIYFPPADEKADKRTTELKKPIVAHTPNDPLQLMYQGHTQLLYWLVKYPWPFDNRDYVFHKKLKVFNGPKYEPDPETNALEAVGDITEETSFAFISANSSTDKSNIAELPKTVRVCTYGNKAFFRQYKEHKDVCEFFMIAYDDPGLSIPNSLLNWFTEKALPQFLDNQLQAVKDYPYQVEQVKQWEDDV